MTDASAEGAWQRRCFNVLGGLRDGNGQMMMMMMMMMIMIIIMLVLCPENTSISISTTSTNATIMVSVDESNHRDIFEATWSPSPSFTAQKSNE